MAVQIILGSAGSGKSYELYKMLTNRASNNPDMNYVAVVPEQYSMESQKEIVSMHPRHGAFNTEVVSFNRLAYAVFEELGLEAVEIMDELGKTMVLIRVLEKCKDELKIYGRKISMPGFIEKMKSTISELEQYDIDEDDLNRMIDSCSMRPSLKRKLIDIDVIYREFNKYIDENKLPQELVLSKLCKYIGKSKKVKNSEYFVDGFTGFTPIQKKVVDMLIKYANNVTFAFTLPEEEVDFSRVKEQELFALSKKTILSIKTSCVEMGVPVLKDIIVNKQDVEGQKRPYRSINSGEISHIEQNIFRFSKSQVYEGKCDNVSLHIAGNPRQEARMVASKIKELMVNNISGEEDSLRYKDIAVVSADMDSYYRYIEEAFLEYNIPAFIDHKRKISGNPYIDSILGFLDIIEKDYSYDSVMHFLRLGVLDIERYDIDLFDNYILSNGIRGRKNYEMSWMNEQEESKEDLDVDDISSQENEITKTDDKTIHQSIIDNVREKLFKAISPYKEGITNNTVKEKIETLYSFVIENDYENKITGMAEQFDKEGNKAKRLEYMQAYKELINLLDKIGEFLGAEIISRKEFRNILEAGINSIRIGIIPPGIDSVMVGDIERTRLKDIKKVMFVIGANDGSIPKNTSGSGVISDVERDFLVENDFVLAPTSRENAFKQKFYLYNTFTKPSTKLFISYSKSNSSGEEIRPSYIIAVVKKLFSDLEVIDEELFEEFPEAIASKQDAFRYMAKAIGNYRIGCQDEKTNQIMSILSSKEEYREILIKMIDGAFYSRNNEKLTPELAAQLYGIENTVGITRLEKFAACAYSHFINNGLKLNQRRQYEFAAYDLGNVYHYAIDNYCRFIKNASIDWSTITEQQRKEIVHNSVDEALKKLNLHVLQSSARNAYIKQRVTEVTEKTVAVLGQHLVESGFKPTYYEYPVEHGRVDRVDEFIKDNRLYIKVIDYKSGKKKFSLNDTFFGLQLQLVVYLKEVIEKERKKNKNLNVLPGGAFYYHISNPLISKPDFEEEIKRYRAIDEYKDMNEEELRQIIAEDYQYEEFKMSGIVNSNDEVIDAIDPLARVNGYSKIIPIKYTKNGEVSKTYNDKVMGPEEMNCLLEYIDYKTESLKSQIYEGVIEANPYKDSCNYCIYKGICGFDKTLGDEFKIKPKLKGEELIAYMKNKEEYKVEYTNDEDEMED